MANPLIVGGRLTATGTGAVGIYCSGDTTIAHVDSITALTSISVFGGAMAAVFGNQFDPTTKAGAGTIEYRYGDRSAWDVANYPTRHASDIEGATFDYHNDPANPPLSAALTNTHIFVGNASNVAADVAMSGDATMANTGALTIANDAVTYAKMQNISATQRALGRNTAGAGNAEEVRASQVLDWIGSTRGAILYRGTSNWDILTPGACGYVLMSNGVGADPSYQSIVSAAINV